MQLRRRLAHIGVGIVAASAGLTVWSGLASAGGEADKRVFVSQTDTHRLDGCNEDKAASVSSL